MDDITLPPLPPAEWLGYDDPERGDFHGHSFDEMREFARAAVLLDRQQRATVECPMCCAEVVRVAGAYDTPAPSAEPVAWMYTTQHSDGRRYLTRYQPDLSTYKADTVWPLYTTPPDHTALLRQALDALGHFDDVDKTDAAIDALRAALAKEPK